MIYKSEPKIEFIDDQNKIRFEGIFIIKSYWEEDKLMSDKIADFIKGRDEFILEFAIFYLDSVSRKIFFELFVALKDELLKIPKLTIDWYYDEEDESIYELGDVLTGFLTIPFNFIKND